MLAISDSCYLHFEVRTSLSTIGAAHSECNISVDITPIHKTKDLYTNQKLYISSPVKSFRREKDKEEMMVKILGLSIGLILLISLVAAGGVSCLNTPEEAPEELQAEELMLSDFPAVFYNDTIIVIGNNASLIEEESADTIAVRLENLTGNTPINMNEAILSDDNKTGYNLIIVGTPDSNGLLQVVYNLTNATEVTEEFPGANKGVLEILRNPWNVDKAMLLVEGSDEWGVKAGSERIDKGPINIEKRMIITRYFKKDEGQITHPILSQIYSNATFYKVTKGITLPPSFSIVVEYNGTEYPLPSQFNKLMLDSGIELLDSNVVELAKAFVIVSRPEDFSQISFLEESLMDEVKYGITYKVRLKTWSKINGVSDDWEFGFKENQFSEVKRIITGTLVGNYTRDVEGPFPPVGSVTVYSPQIIKDKIGGYGNDKI